MGFAEWEMLAAMAADGAALTKRIFPGGVVVERVPTAIQLRREGG